jgi:phytoene synthase
MQDSPTALLKKHGKSFNFARLFLSKQTGIAAARLYGFCRIVDDIADESDDKDEARQQLTDIKNAISVNNKSHPQVGDFLHLCEAYNINRANGITLIDGVTDDLNLQVFESPNDIIQYAFKVAGVVGLMMAPILGAQEKGHRFAIDLGIAMQLTNIARDVMEDAKMNRRYVPGEWMKNISAQQIVANEQGHQMPVQAAISRLLTLAQDYYKSGLAGLYYLPSGNRTSIAVAAYVYREIGHLIRKRNCSYWQGRVVVSTPRKVMLACSALKAITTKKIAANEVEHEDELHKYLKDLYHTEVLP